MVVNDPISSGEDSNSTVPFVPPKDKYEEIYPDYVPSTKKRRNWNDRGLKKKKCRFRTQSPPRHHQSRSRSRSVIRPVKPTDPNNITTSFYLAKTEAMETNTRYREQQVSLTRSPARHFIKTKNTQIQFRFPSPEFSLLKHPRFIIYFFPSFTHTFEWWSLVEVSASLGTAAVCCSPALMIATGGIKMVSGTYVRATKISVLFAGG